MDYSDFNSPNGTWFPIPSVPRFLCSSAKVVQTFIESGKVKRQAVSVGIFLLLRRERIPPENLSPFRSVLGNADGNGNKRLTEKRKPRKKQHTGRFRWDNLPVCCFSFFLGKIFRTIIKRADGKLRSLQKKESAYPPPFIRLASLYPCRSTSSISLLLYKTFPPST